MVCYIYREFDTFNIMGCSHSDSRDRIKIKGDTKSEIRRYKSEVEFSPKKEKDALKKEKLTEKEQKERREEQRAKMAKIRKLVENKLGSTKNTKIIKLKDFSNSLNCDYIPSSAAEKTVIISDIISDDCQTLNSQRGHKFSGMQEYTIYSKVVTYEVQDSAFDKDYKKEKDTLKKQLKNKDKEQSYRANKNEVAKNKLKNKDKEQSYRANKNDFGSIDNKKKEQSFRVNKNDVSKNKNQEKEQSFRVNKNNVPKNKNQEKEQSFRVNKNEYGPNENKKKTKYFEKLKVISNDIPEDELVDFY